MRNELRAAAATLAILSLAAPARAEEGMWTFDNFPGARMQDEMGWAPDQAWLDRVMRATARLPACSGANVSGEGLLLTNHHCVVACLNQLSSAEQNYLNAGFAARTREEERRCPGMAVQVLDAISDVTLRIEGAAESAPGESFAQVRDAEIERIERACTGGGRRCEVVTLYQGGRYALYEYRRYDDVRLVFAPEYAMAQFGGEADNFNFPRYSVDFAALRLYQNGAPARTPAHLDMRFTAPEADEIVLVSGNPGVTARLKTASEVAFERDVVVPWREAALIATRDRLAAYAALGPEQARVATDALENVTNYAKAYTGRRLALADATVLARVAAAETDLQARVQRNLASQREIGDAWGEIARAQEAQRPIFFAYQNAELRAGERSDLFVWARDIVRNAAERGKPDAERLPRYAEAHRGALDYWVRSPRPVRADWEALNLSIWLNQMQRDLTARDPLAQRILGAETPDALAQRLATSRLADPAYRAQLWDGGAEAVAASDDPMIMFVRAWDTDARAVRAEYQAQVEAPVARAHERIARVRFRAFEERAYPDATFSPRLSYGRVEGWSEDGREIAAFTHAGDWYARGARAAPTGPWRTARVRIDPNTVLNVASSNDIISGNSGSALLDREGRVLGVVFDGNIHALAGEYAYDGARNRAVSVSSQMIQTALSVYGMDALAAELGARPGRAR